MQVRVLQGLFCMMCTSCIDVCSRFNSYDLHRWKRGSATWLVYVGTAMGNAGSSPVHTLKVRTVYSFSRWPSNKTGNIAFYRAMTCCTITNVRKRKQAYAGSGACKVVDWDGLVYLLLKFLFHGSSKLDKLSSFRYYLLWEVLIIGHTGSTVQILWVEAAHSKIGKISWACNGIDRGKKGSISLGVVNVSRPNLKLNANVIANLFGGRRQVACAA